MLYNKTVTSVMTCLILVRADISNIPSFAKNVIESMGYYIS